MQNHVQIGAVDTHRIILIGGNQVIGIVKEMHTIGGNGAGLQIQIIGKGG